jgi:hypothetical protein
LREAAGERMPILAIPARDVVDNRPARVIEGTAGNYFSAEFVKVEHGTIGTVAQRFPLSADASRDVGSGNLARLDEISPDDDRAIELLNDMNLIINAVIER